MNETLDSQELNLVLARLKRGQTSESISLIIGDFEVNKNEPVDFMTFLKIVHHVDKQEQLTQTCFKVGLDKDVADHAKALWTACDPSEDGHILHDKLKAQLEKSLQSY